MKVHRVGESDAEVRAVVDLEHEACIAPSPLQFAGHGREGEVADVGPGDDHGPATAAVPSRSSTRPLSTARSRILTLASTSPVSARRSKPKSSASKVYAVVRAHRHRLVGARRGRCSSAVTVALAGYAALVRSSTPLRSSVKLTLTLTFLPTSAVAQGVGRGISPVISVSLEAPSESTRSHW